MEELIKITEKDDKQLVSARELHLFLEVKTDFTDWCKRMFEYGFVEGVEFTSFLGKNTRGPGRPKKDYALTLDCAKEISMIQRSEKGKQARKYFIACEKKLIEIVKPKTTLELLESAVVEIKQNQILIENQKELIAIKSDIIDVQAPKVEYHDNVLMSEYKIRTTQIAAEFDMSAQKMNKILKERGVQWKVNGSWVLCAKFAAMGYTDTITHYSADSHGKPIAILSMVWTQKGRKKIHDMMNDLGYSSSLNN